jgi:hypothetical protein
MIIEQVYVVVPETFREQNVLLDVVNAHYPSGPRTPTAPGTDGVEFRVCGTFHLNDDQLTKVRSELRKSDEQRKAEWMTKYPGR